MPAKHHPPKNHKKQHVKKHKFYQSAQQENLKYSEKVACASAHSPEINSQKRFFHN